MTSTVERLRAEMVEDWMYSRVTTTIVPYDILAALLDVVERLANGDLNNAHLYCPFCDGDHMFDTVGGYQHVPDCPWLAARRLCGMGGDA